VRENFSSERENFSSERENFSSERENFTIVVMESLILQKISQSFVSETSIKTR